MVIGGLCSQRVRTTKMARLRGRDDDETSLSCFHPRSTVLNYAPVHQPRLQAPAYFLVSLLSVVVSLPRFSLFPPLNFSFLLQPLFYLASQAGSFVYLFFHISLFPTDKRIFLCSPLFPHVLCPASSLPLARFVFLLPLPQFYPFPRIERGD